ncbi:MAG: SLC13 family permease [Sulfurimonadaceae bacterium]
MKLFIALTLLLLLGLLIRNKHKPALLFGGLATLYYVMDLITFKEWSASYLNSSLLILILLLLVSLALEKTILVEYFSKWIITDRYRFSLLKLGVVTAAFSAFLNNTAVVATLMGALQKNKHHMPSKLLIPLSYFALFGGTMTLVGTSTNLIVNSFVIENGLESLKMFDFFFVGACITFFGITALLLVHPLLPAYKASDEKIEEHLIEAKVLPTSSLVGKSIKTNKLRNLEYLFLLEIQRGEKTISPVTPDETIETGDRLVFSGDLQHIEVLKQFDGLLLGGDVDVIKLHLVDTIITPESSLIGQKVKEANFRSKFDAAIVSLKRGSQNISKIGEAELQAGDRLVLAVGNDFEQRDNLSKNFYLFSNIQTNQKFDPVKSFFIIASFLGVILLSALGVVSLLKALIVLLVGFLAFKVLRIQDLKRRFPYEIMIIVGSSLAISKVMISSGLGHDLASFIIQSFGMYGVYGSFIGVYLVTLLLTELITNNAAAALSFPVAFATALALGVSPLPFIFAVAFGASASFMIPYGYQTNLMVSSVGNYKTTDFLKIGWIISLVYSSVVLIAVPIFFPF